MYNEGDNGDGGGDDDDNDTLHFYRSFPYVISLDPHNNSVRQKGQLLLSPNLW